MEVVEDKKAEKVAKRKAEKAEKVGNTAKMKEVNQI
jgi:flagellar biosynthesis protein FlhB